MSCIEQISDQKIQNLQWLCEQLKEKSIKEKLNFLKGVLAGPLQKKIPGKALMRFWPQKQQYLFLLLVALEQFPLLENRPWEKKDFFSILANTDHFYQEIGGILGYHLKLLELLENKKRRLADAKLYSPPFIDISQNKGKVSQYIKWGIQALPQIAEFYPLGGAADRLHLQDETTKEELPAAKLKFAGNTLLEHLIFNLQARESLYFQTFQKQLITPIVMMTSAEKKNHFHVLSILEEKKWFGRPKDSFFIMEQPLVPTMDKEGKWCEKTPGELLLKPSGHGVLWKLAYDLGVFSWLQEKNRKKALIRQINNPLSGVDYGLLAFLGIGVHQDMDFGFASCPTEKDAAEGMNVLVERKKEGAYEYSLSNIEYCDLANLPKEETPSFLANTNLLLVDLPKIQQAVQKNPFPGILLNMKEANTIEGVKKVGRLETTMQNMADELIETSLQPRVPPKVEKTYITCHQRGKTISATKRVYRPGKSYLETPEKCFYDFYVNAHQLLQEAKINLPLLRSLEEYFEKGPAFLFQYHPALGPLYPTIQEKIQQGEIGGCSELVCSIRELIWRKVELFGSLVIEAENILGQIVEGQLFYSSEVGKCILEEVKIQNAGVDYEKSKPFWNQTPYRKESVHIELKGKSLFYAKGITFTGSHHFIVPDNQMLWVKQKQGVLSCEWMPYSTEIKKEQYA